MASGIDIADIIAGKSPGTVPAALKNKARKILRSATKPIKETVRGIAPTITLGTANAVSDIVDAGNTGALTVQGCTDSLLSSRIKITSGIFAYTNGTQDTLVGASCFVGPTQAPVVTGPRLNCLGARGEGVMFVFDGQEFNVGLNVTGGALRIYATDLATGIREVIQAADIVPTNGKSFTKVNLGSRAPYGRLMEVYFGPGLCFIYGFCFHKYDQVYAPELPDDWAFSAIGDSWFQGANISHIRAIPAYIAGEFMGTRRVNINAIAGTGPFNIATNAKSYLDRLNNGDLDVATIGTQDLVLMMGSVNDSGSSDGAVQTAVQNCVTRLMQAQPDAIIVVAGQQYMKNFQTTSARNTAYVNAVAAAANGDPRVLHINSGVNGANAEKWSSGTGTDAATTGDGSNDLYGNADGTHLNANGNPNYGIKMGLSILKRLQALVDA